MTREWRSLTESESKIIKNLLKKSGYHNKYKISDYLASKIDNCGSLILMHRNESWNINNFNQKMISDGYFDDSLSSRKWEPGCPLVNIILFSNNENLSELQIYKDDGAEICKVVQAGGIFFID